MSALVLDFPIRFKLDTAEYVPELEHEWPVFVDWVTIRQQHTGRDLPRVYSGVNTREDRDGIIECQTVLREKVVGSFDDTMWVRCDGTSVEFDGNISRWDRRDNVFGYSLPETIARINRLLGRFQLPPFTVGDRMRFADSGVVWTGARLSRLDITCNYATGSAADAERVIIALGQHHVGRLKGQVTPDGATVLYGYGASGTSGGTKYVSGKCYIKHVELRNNLKKKSGSHVDSDLIDWCRSLGIVREEFTLKSRFLTQSGLCWLGEIEPSHLFSIYRRRTQFRRFRDMELKDTSALSAGARGTLARYEQGEPHGLTRPTFYRHRSEILKTVGIDISVTRNVEKVVLPVKIIELQAMVAPEWYRRKYE
jgi:hypothetical protein